MRGVAQKYKSSQDACREGSLGKKLSSFAPSSAISTARKRVCSNIIARYFSAHDDAVKVRGDRNDDAEIDANLARARARETPL